MEMKKSGEGGMEKSFSVKFSSIGDAKVCCGIDSENLLKREKKIFSHLVFFLMIGESTV